MVVILHQSGRVAFCVHTCDMSDRRMGGNRLHWPFSSYYVLHIYLFLSFFGNRLLVHSSDPNLECTAYYYQPVSAAIAANEFPPIWTVATIVSSDTNAQAKYQSIQSQIPNIQPKGTQPASLTGDFSNFTPTYPSSDPDCWWTYDQCTTPKLAGLPPDLAVVPEVCFSLIIIQ
jgi:hypothetical protein